MITPTPTALISLFGLCAVCLAGAVLVSLTLPELADAALRNAAGGGGGAGFATLTRYLDRLASYLIPVGGAGAVLGLIAGGFMFMAGNPGAQKVSPRPAPPAQR